jgi:hypothetical protein
MDQFLTREESKYTARRLYSTLYRSYSQQYKYKLSSSVYDVEMEAGGSSLAYEGSLVVSK